MLHYFAKIISVGLILLLIESKLISQKSICGSEIKSLIEQKLHIDYLINLQAENLLSPRSPFKIQVVVHNLWHNANDKVSDQRILDQIESLNQDFNGNNGDITLVPEEFKDVVGISSIQFCLANKIIDGKRKLGIIRKRTQIKEFNGNEIYSDSLGGSTPWDQEKFLNIWVVNIGESISGYSSYPWKKDSINDGAVINTNYFGKNSSNNNIFGRVLTHEIGHYLGLLHIWGDGNGCTNDDGINDTPLQDGPYYGCPSYPQKDCSESEMFMNYMDYVDDPCMYMFTKEQVGLMQKSILNSRLNLIKNSLECNPTNFEKKILKTYFPNPTHDFILFKFSEAPVEILDVNIYNSLGQQIESYSIVINDQFEMDVSKLLPGFYFIKLNREIVKIIKT